MDLPNGYFALLWEIRHRRVDYRIIAVSIQEVGAWLTRFAEKWNRSKQDRKFQEAWIAWASSCQGRAPSREMHAPLPTRSKTDSKPMQKRAIKSYLSPLTGRLDQAPAAWFAENTRKNTHQVST